jgi:hypothetical protein
MLFKFKTINSVIFLRQLIRFEIREVPWPCHWWTKNTSQTFLRTSPFLKLENILHYEIRNLGPKVSKTLLHHSFWTIFNLIPWFIPTIFHHVIRTFKRNVIRSWRAHLFLKFLATKIQPISEDSEKEKKEVTVFKHETR